MKAIILAAGLGLRMMPLTANQPKPMIMVAGKPLIDHVLDWLSAAGIVEAVVNTHYLAEQLEAHLLKRSSQQKPRIFISREEELLETGGGIKKALNILGDSPFIAVNSDSICLCPSGADHPLINLQKFWNDKTMDALLLLKSVKDAVGYHGAGDFFINKDNVVIRRDKNQTAPYVFTGIQIIHPRLFASAPSGAFSLNLLYDIGKKQDGTLPKIHARIHDGKWLHVGDPQAIKLAEQNL